MPNRRKDANDAKYLASLGYDATINEDVSPEARPRDGLFALSLTDEAALRLLTNVTDATLIAQREDWIKRQNDGTYEPAHEEPSADTPQQELLYEVLQLAKLDFPTVWLSVDLLDDFLYYANNFYQQSQQDIDNEIVADEFKRDSLWSTWEIVKGYGLAKKLTRKVNESDEFDPETMPQVRDEDGVLQPSGGRWRDAFIDATKGDYPPNYPVQILLASRKAIWGGSKFYIHDVENPELADTTSPLIQIAEANDYYDSDPRVKALLDAGGLRKDDGWLQEAEYQSALKGVLDPIYGPGGIYDPPGGTPPPGGPADPGDGDPFDPTDPPGTPFPPGGRDGGEQPPPGGYPPAAPDPTLGGRVELVCEDNPIYSVTGTNGTETFASFLGIDIPSWLTVPLVGAPLPDVYRQSTDVDIYASTLAAIAASGELPSGATVTRVAFCYHWIATVYFGISALGIESLISKKASAPKLVAHRTSGSTTLTTYQLRNDALYDMVNFAYGVSGTPVELHFAWKVGEATPDQHIAISQFDLVDTLRLQAKLYAAMSDFFGTLPVSPILWLGLEGFDYLYAEGCDRTPPLHLDLSTAPGQHDITSCWTGAVASFTSDGWTMAHATFVYRRHLHSAGHTAIQVTMTGYLGSTAEPFVYATNPGTWFNLVQYRLTGDGADSWRDPAEGNTTGTVNKPCTQTVNKTSSTIVYNWTIDAAAIEFRVVCLLDNGQSIPITFEQIDIDMP